MYQKWIPNATKVFRLKLKREFYIIATPIGNPGDLSPRAIEVLLNSDLIIGEDFKPATSLLKRIGAKAELSFLNEHTKPEEYNELISQIEKHSRISIISDAGTPILADPGWKLVEDIWDQELAEIKSVPGANSLICGLIQSGFDPIPFLFPGFLPREKDERKKQISKIMKLSYTLVLLETPYRYKDLIKDLVPHLGQRRIFLGTNLTTTEEKSFRGYGKELIQELERFPKAPPVIVIEGNGKNVFG